MTPLERAARALCSLDRFPADPITDGKAPWQDYLPRARAVLHAVREPSEAMTEAGAEITSHISSTEADESFAGDAADIWRVMIDTALSGRG